jgi:hypothetical protein
MEDEKIYEAIIGVMSDIGAVGKDKTNEQQKFKYRGIDDVMNALSPAMVKNNVFVVPEVTNEIRDERVTEKFVNNEKKVSTLFYTRLYMTYKFYTLDGSYIEAKVIGEAMDSGDKVTNKAMSIAFKYACFQVFCIPTEEMKDPDADVHSEIKPKNEAKKTTNSSTENLQECAGDEEKDTFKESQQAKDNFEKVKNMKISEIKVNLIKAELDRTGITDLQIFKRYKVEILNDITEGQFPFVMSALKKSKDKVESKDEQ